MTQATILPEHMRRPAATSASAIELPRADAATVALFFDLGTQWRFHPVTGERIGLDNAAIRPTAELTGVPVTPGLLTDLREMEAAALTEWAGKR